jgi:hypothetical protein
MSAPPPPTDRGHFDEDQVEDVRLSVYASFARTGRAPTVQDLAEETALTTAQVELAFDALHRNRAIVLGADRAIVMAHPFSSVPLGFSVMGARTLWWGGCAWDSFAIPHLLHDEPEVPPRPQLPAPRTRRRGCLLRISRTPRAVLGTHRLNDRRHAPRPR